MHEWLLNSPIIRLFVIIALGYLVGEIKFPCGFRRRWSAVRRTGLRRMDSFNGTAFRNLRHSGWCCSYIASAFIGAGLFQIFGNSVNALTETGSLASRWELFWCLFLDKFHSLFPD